MGRCLCDGVHPVLVRCSRVNDTHAVVSMLSTCVHIFSHKTRTHAWKLRLRGDLCKHIYYKSLCTSKHIHRVQRCASHPKRHGAHKRDNFISERKPLNAHTFVPSYCRRHSTCRNLRGAIRMSTTTVVSLCTKHILHTADIYIHYIVYYIVVAYNNVFLNLNLRSPLASSCFECNAPEHGACRSITRIRT